MAAPAVRPAVNSSTVRAGLRVLLLGIRMQPRPFAAAVAGGLLYGGMTVAGAVVLGQVTDRVIFPAFATGRISTSALVGAAAAIVAVAVAKALGIIGRRVGGSWMQLSLHADTRRMVTRRYLSLPVEWHRGRPTGMLLSTANADVEATWSPIAPLPMTVGVVFMLLTTGVVLINSDPFLAAIGFVIGPAIGLLNWRYTRAYREPARRAQERRGHVSAIAHESFDGATVVKTLGLEEDETKRFGVAADALRDDMVILGRIRSSFDPVLDALPQVGILLVVAIGARRAAAGAVSPGQVIEFAYLFSLLALPLRIIGYLLGELPRSVAGWERVSAVMDNGDEVAFGDRRSVDKPGAATVELASLSYRFADSDQPAVDNVTLDITAGTVIAVVGPTGAGKSTLAGLLLRLMDPADGRVLLDGIDLRDLRDGSLATEAALVFQESFIFDDTVRGNVTLDAGYDDDDVWTALRLAQADTFVTDLSDGLSTQLGERGTTLSGGQKQRVALARALVRRPRLLVMDDATSAIDVTVEGAILRALRETQADATVILVAYRKSTIELADEVVFVADGRVVGRGTHRELLQTVPAYADLLRAYEDPA